MSSPAKRLALARGVRARVLLVLLVTAAASFFAGSHFGDTGSAAAARRQGWGGTQLAAGSGASGKAHTLVVYVFSQTDTEYESNMRFFLRWGVSDGDGCDYIFIIQTGEGTQVRR